MISCKKYTMYLHKSEVTPLKWHEKVLMKSHFLMCKLCQQYTFENSLFNKILQQHQEDIIISDEEMEQYKNDCLKKLNI